MVVVNIGQTREKNEAEMGTLIEFLGCPFPLSVFPITHMNKAKKEKRKASLFNSSKSQKIVAEQGKEIKNEKEREERSHGKWNRGGPPVFPPHLLTSQAAYKGSDATQL